jgi:hypothetical protein
MKKDNVDDDDDEGRRRCRRCAVPPVVADIDGTSEAQIGVSESADEDDEATPIRPGLDATPFVAVSSSVDNGV